MKNIGAQYLKNCRMSFLNKDVTGINTQYFKKIIPMIVNLKKFSIGKVILRSMV